MNRIMLPKWDDSTRIIGMDFSGAVDAGRKIWVTDAVLHGDTLHVRYCRPAAMLAKGQTAREAATAGVRRFLERAGNAVVGCDFPFSLARGFIRYDDWETFAANFARDFPTPEDMKAYTNVLGNDIFERGGRVTRQTDRDARTPFSPHNLRLFRQTYYGIRDLLAPLSLNGKAIIPPLTTTAPVPPDGVLTLLEICPASLLKSADMYDETYKEKGKVARERRAAILEHFSDPSLPLHIAPLTRTVRSRVLNDREGDSLDSVLAAYSAAWALRMGELAQLPTLDERMEGRVYGWQVGEPARTPAVQPSRSTAPALPQAA